MVMIHGLWHDENLLSNNQTESWRSKNPGIPIRIWTFEEAVTLLDGNELRFYHALPFLLQQTDFLRAVILRRCGGLYLDMDMECLRPLDCFLTRELFFGNTNPASSRPLYCNAIFGGRAGHPFLETLVAAMMSTRQDITQSWQGISTTGSKLFTRVVKAGGWESYAEPCGTFYPLSRKHTGDAYTMHHWHASWRRVGAWRPTVGKK